jgi:hypothetical protein
MPCDSVQLNRIDLPKMAPELSEAALRSAGVRNLTRRGTNAWSFSFEGKTYNISDGELTSYDATDAELSTARNAIARGYSEQILQVAAKKNNWTLKKVGDRAYVAAKR